MGPESNDFYYALVFENLVDQTVPYVKTARVSTRKIPNQLFVRRRILEWIGSKELQEFLSFVP